MSGAGPTPSFDVLQQAAQWYALLRGDDAGECERGAWRQWLAASDAHRAAWKCVEKVGRRFEPLQPEGERQAAASALAAGRSGATRRKLLQSLAALSGVAVLGWGATRGVPAAWRADYRTGVGEVQAITLADGTRVWLNTASALDADYRPSLRRLHLLDGEMLVETARDHARPLVADSRHGRMRALGTVFTVRQLEETTYLAVYAGAVEVRTAGSGATRVVGAGEQLRFGRDRIEAPLPADPARRAWSRGVLLADDLPLGQLVDELGRYRRGHLAVAPAAADLRVMGTYPLDDPERALAMLEAALPVRVCRTLPWWVTVEAR
jgi:transmembrane sensor